MFHAGQLAATGLLIARHLFSRGIVQVGAKGRDLDHLVLASAAKNHVHDTKTPPDDESAAKQALHLLGRGVGRHIKILGAQANQQVAHRTANHVRFKTGIVQGAHHIDGALVHQIGVNAVGLHRYIDPFAKFGLLTGSGPRGLAQQFINKFFDHSFSGGSVRRVSTEQVEYAPSALDRQRP